MNSYRIVLIVAILIFCVWGMKIYAGTLQMRTYYPAPSGYFQNLGVNIGLQIPYYGSYCYQHPSGGFCPEPPGPYGLAHAGLMWIYYQ